jgi:hypothetical protein
MRKLKLDLDRLTVESFDMGTDAPTGRGTVNGRVLPSGVEDKDLPESDNIICVSVGCFNSYIYGTCNISCGSTCWDPTCQSCTCPQNNTCDYTCHYPGCGA